MIKNRLFGLALGCLAVGANATTLTVDGIGGAGSYATITAAVQALSADGVDGTPDVINVTATVLDNHPAILINGTSAAIGAFPRLTDDIIINGNPTGGATRCRLALGANIGTGTGIGVTTSRIAVELAPSQKVNFENFVVIPQTMGSTAGTTTVLANAITVDEADAATVLAGAQFNLSGCDFTGTADINNTPLSVTAAVPAGVTATYFGGDTSSLAAYLSFQSQPSGAQTFTHSVSNCVFAHGRRDNVFVGSDANATGSGAVNITNSRSTRCVFGGLGDGLFLTNAENTTINCTDFTSDFNDEHGIFAIETNTLGVFMKLNVNEGCTFDSNTFRGISLSQSGATATSRIRMTVAGTQAKPVVISSNRNRGFRSECISSAPVGTAPQIASVSYLTLHSNLSIGWEFNEADLAYPTTAGPLFTNCIFTRNANLTPTFGQFVVQDTNATAGGVQFNNCTFHDPHSTDLTAGSSIATNASAATNLTYNIKNSIFSGSNGNDLAIRNNNSGANVVYNLTNCSLVGFGTYKLATPPIVLTVAAVVNQVNVITADPIYQSVTTTSLDLLKVRNGSPTPDGYAGAAEAGANLSGAAAFVGDFLVKMVTGPGVAIVNGATLNTTNATYPFQWMVANPAADPATLGAAGIRDVRDTTKYWDIQYSPTTATVTADLTLTWPDSAGFTDGGIYHYSSADARWLYGPVPNGSGTPGTIETSGDPNTVTHTEVTSFSPFSVGSAGAAPVSLSGFTLE